MTPLLTVKQVAEFYQVHPVTIYRDPKKFGGFKKKGVGWRFTEEAVYRKAGIVRGEK